MDTAGKEYSHQPRKFYWSALRQLKAFLSPWFSLRVNIGNSHHYSSYKTVFKDPAFHLASEPCAKATQQLLWSSGQTGSLSFSMSASVLLTIGNALLNISHLRIWDCQTQAICSVATACLLLRIHDQYIPLSRVSILYY